MKRYTTIALATALLSTSALASIATVKNMDDEATVTVTGQVDSVDNSTEFTLRDATDTITVDVDSRQSVVLKKGDTVTVTGKVDRDITGTDINATKVTIKKDIARAVTDSIEGNTPISFEGATAYDIDDLPSKGVVKVSGTVIDVDSKKEFTLRDDTGEIDVDITSAEAASLKEGAKVTVVGRVNNGITGKGIDATKVLVTSNS